MLPPAPSAVGSQREALSRETPQKKLQPLFLASCPCAGGKRNKARHLPALRRGFPSMDMVTTQPG